MVIWCVFSLITVMLPITNCCKKSPFKAVNMGENAGRTIRTVSKLMDVNSMCYYKMNIW